jgi:putative peptidoglycan lipid II flippase
LRSLFINGLIVTVCLGIGRILGFIRDIAITNFFGQTYQADMAVLILTTQDLLLNFFIGNAFPLALMAVFAKNANALRHCVYDFHKILTPLMIAVIFVVIFNINYVVSWLSPGLPLPFNEQVSKYLLVSMLSIPMTIYAAILSSALNFSNLFSAPALGNAGFNFIICCSLLLCWMFPVLNPFYTISVGVITGAFFRWGYQLIYLPKESADDCKNTLKIDKKGFFFHYLKLLFSTSIIFILPIIARAIASEHGMGQISIFNFISKIIDLPVMLISGAVVTVLMPKLIKPESNTKAIMFSCAFLFFIFSIVAVIVYFTAPYVIQILLSFGKFSSDNLLLIEKQLQMASVMLPAYSVAFFLATAIATTEFSRIYPILCLSSIAILYYFGAHHIQEPIHIYIYLACNYLVFCFLAIALYLKNNIFYLNREEYSKC